ncbi:HipA N-terminal domain-containing protein [Bradyrhizobium sp. U531]|uniref:HipA N-terminal domain-containing protein n=1 Tax=Bradyrhizobium sp. U531 TaxID=3053458 RepID=UPI003F41E94C
MLPLSLSLLCVRDRYIGAAVVAVSDNLLPDSMPIRRRMAERVHAQGIDAYDLLTGVGRDCVGPLQFLPDGIEPGAAGAVDDRPVDDEEIARLLGNLCIGSP